MFVVIVYTCPANYLKIGSKHIELWPLNYLVYLGVPSSLRWAARNDTPQVTVDSSSGSVAKRHAGPLLDVPDPVVSGAPSWSPTINFAFH